MIREKLHAYAAHVEEHGGEEWVFSFVAEGHPMRRVAELTGCSSRGLLYSWIKLGGEERKQKLREARHLAAHSIAEDAGEILDDLAGSGTMLNSADVSLATSRAKYRQWLAGMRNREDYGDRAGVEVNVSFGDLHLDALRRNSAQVVEAELATATEDADFEVVEEPKRIPAEASDQGSEAPLPAVFEGAALPAELEELL